MPKKSINTAKPQIEFISWFFIFLFLLIWEISVKIFSIEKWILPAPSAIFLSLINSFPLIMDHLERTILETVLGLLAGTLIGIFFAVLIDWSSFLKKMIYPFLLFTQTVPFITIAPLLVVWFGYGLTAKIIIIALVCFFPVTLNLSQGLAASEKNYLKLARSLGASKWQVFKLIKLPSSLRYFFSGLSIAASYSVISAVVSEWIGSDKGLGILLIRSSKSYLTDRVFAVILVISFLSLVLVRTVGLLEYKFTNYG